MNQEISNVALALHKKINRKIIWGLKAIENSRLAYEQEKKEKNGLNSYLARSNYDNQLEYHENEIKYLVYEYKYLFEFLTKSSQDRKLSFTKIYDFFDKNIINKEKSALMFFVELEINDADFTQKRRVDESFYKKNETNTRLIEEKIKRIYENTRTNNRNNNLISNAMKELEDFKVECLSYDNIELRKLMNSDELSENEISIIRVILKQRYDTEIKDKGNYKNIK